MIEVKVTGPGQTFDGEFEAIKAALEELGCKVESNNMYPPRKEWIRRAIESGFYKNRRVKLEAVHLPWKEE